MPKRKFKATEGLLEDTMTKQSGVLEKALLESVMNAVDANATKVEIDLDETSVTIEDDGDGITEERVEKYFERFGEKDNDVEQKEFGKFRLGRGQMFSFGTNVWRSHDNIMVVSLDAKEVTLELPHVVGGGDDSVIDRDGDRYTIDTEGLSYAWLKSSDPVNGTKIQISLYNRLENLDSTLDEFKKLARYISWFHDIEVKINGEPLNEEPDVLHETDVAYYCTHPTSWMRKSDVYNKGALVNDFNLGPVNTEIISKKDLDVTLDRKDILENDETWKRIQDEYEDLAIDLLIQKDDIDDKQRNWLLDTCADNPHITQRIRTLPVVTDVNGEELTINDIAGKEVTFANKGDKVAQEVMKRTDTIVVDNQYENSLTNLIQSTNEYVKNASTKNYEDIIDDDLQYEMDEVSDSELSKRRMTNLTQMRRFLEVLGFDLDVRAGHSKHLNVWKDGEGTLYIDKGFLNATKQELHTQVAYRCVYIACMEGDTRSGTSENISVRKSFMRHMNGDSFGSAMDYPTALDKLMDGNFK